jgi:lactoylglutathione lyase
MEQNYLIMVNGTTVIGLFQGMFEKNILTFNPGLSLDGTALESFTDVRDLQAVLREKGIEFAAEADETSDGPASFVIEDPDGNPILVDQFSGRP